MSAGGAFGGARGYQPKPPEKGVFPLDHFGECQEWKQQYMACLKAKSSDAQACQEISKKYLQCRMDRNLMARQDLQELGFKDGPQQNGMRDSAEESENAKRKKAGFTAGIPKWK